MTKRLTPKWTQTLTEAYGPNGTVGSKGEQFVASLFTKYNIPFNHVIDDRSLQVKGVDFIIYPDTYKLGVQVKANLSSRTKLIVTTKIHSLQRYSPIWIHVHPKTQRYLMYNSRDLVKHILNQSIPVPELRTFSNEQCMILDQSNLKFIQLQITDLQHL